MPFSKNWILICIWKHSKISDVNIVQSKERLFKVYYNIFPLEIQSLKKTKEIGVYASWFLAFQLWVCFSAPAISISGGGSQGRVEITYDGETGSICNTYWSKYDARVLCKSKGYVDGEVLNPSPSDGKVFLSKMRCDGTENSIFRCNNSGWDVYETTTCGGHATVMCYKNSE